MSLCVARVLGNVPQQIPGTREFLFNTTECAAAAARKIVIDDGDASFGICAACFKRFMTKGSKKDEWWGWFDCSIPPHAPVKGSKWYQDVVTRAWEEYERAAANAAPPSPSASGEALGDEKRQAASVVQEEDLSIKEQLEKDLEAAQAVAKELAAGGKTTKELLEARRKVFDLKKQIMLL